jgi:hypothetical protein
MSAQAGQASSPLRQLTTLAARAKHISANSVLDGATCVAFRTFRYFVWGLFAVDCGRGVTRRVPAAR